ncbi:hypothetical protein HDC34_002430 [Pseudoclavibacter sp. JAI123]|uniref:hypothetical protein n=1 Tax=Pseudoclavibacter sp. JAI123 TaxID=2723065 RepID=UPI0015C8A4AE|nr:hypothetical protein [Pseudoclavibacter sp. JAI123]NYF14136.1 hypothetical protein [Pseudoclavibacter sp. JAI123]
MSIEHAGEGHEGAGRTGGDHVVGPENELTLELERIGALPVSERAAEFSRVHQQLGQLLESTPVQLIDGDQS